MGEGILCDFFEKNFCLELASVKEATSFRGGQVILARRAVFGFPFALLGPFGGDGWKALLRRFPGFLAFVVNAEASRPCLGFRPSPSL